ncbi:phosphate acyltransferase PlsX [Rhodothermus profundi]|uniref:Phosphate acyltransferase n=1 Tax=Rhodothermus profundi TaxID=633813 RepID=A0A1M6R730_9BACT|nr:phosphate acyltransferase PlsX [Rhodothermus profundi]SHK28262.1 phosphate:acyl-[acyl carrier protein] acyltransferase [Rhodothermus profundi]
MALRVAVDAMGGDAAPAVVVEGALQALDAAPERLEVQLYGPRAIVEAELEKRRALGREGLLLSDAPDVIGMAESPATAVKTKLRSSIHLGLQAVARGEADAFASAGNTGAVMAAALFILGRLPEVARPSVVGFFPTTRGRCLVLDIGTNVDCKPEHLLQFARMGVVFVERVWQVERPVVGLLNVGEEPGKGNALTKAAYELLQAAPDLNFRGNVEGRDLMHHAADVVVCDGFVGNVMLKVGESMVTAFVEMLRQEMQARGIDAVQQRQVLGLLRGVLRRFDYEEYGGAPLLGVNGAVVIGHGSSSARAIARMILAAAELVEQDVVRSIAEAFHPA